MKNKIIYIIALMFILTVCTQAHEQYHKPMHKISSKEQKQMDKMFEERLKLTAEQKNYIKENRPKHIAQMQENIRKMQKLHDKISEVYMPGLPKYQADIRTAPMKAELALLKQNADKQKQKNRQNFENILTKEQKAEFEKIKQEHAAKRPPMPPKESSD